MRRLFRSRTFSLHRTVSEALSSYRALAERNPEAYRPDVAQTLNNLAILYCGKVAGPGSAAVVVVTCVVVPSATARRCQSAR